MYIYTCIYIYKHIYIYIYTYIYEHIFICMYTYIYLSVSHCTMTSINMMHIKFNSFVNLECRLQTRPSHSALTCNTYLVCMRHELCHSNPTNSRARAAS